MFRYLGVRSGSSVSRDRCNALVVDKDLHQRPCVYDVGFSSDMLVWYGIAVLVTAEIALAGILDRDICIAFHLVDGVRKRLQGGLLRSVKVCFSRVRTELHTGLIIFRKQL